MARVDVVTLVEEVDCGFCCQPFGPNQIALGWCDALFCTHECLENFAEEAVIGRDYIAAQDQAIAKAIEALKTRPDSFVLIHSGDGNEIVSTVLAHPSFLYACLPMLAQLANEDGSIAPP